MKDPRNIHPEARAILVMTTGMATPGLPTLLEQYGYQLDDSCAGLWRLEDSGDSAALVFSDDFTEVAVVGGARENIENVNYVLSRGGWSSAELTTVDTEIEEELLSVLASVEVSDIHQLWKSGTQSEPPSHRAPERSAAQDPSPSSAVAILDESVEELQTALATVERQDETIRQLTRRIQELEGTLRATENQPAVSDPGAAADSRLIAVVEKYLLQQLSVGVLKDTDLVRELGSAGYEVKLSLAKA